MLVFVLPAIYPNKNNTQLGIYIKEHCDALKNYHDYKFVIINASTTSVKNWRNCIEISKYEDNVGHVYQRLTVGFMQSTFPRFSVASYKSNVYGLFKKAINDYGVPDLIYAHFSFPSGYVAMELSERYGVPFVVDEHYSLYFEDKLNPYIVNLTRKVIQNSNAFVCVSEKLRNALYRHTGLCKGIQVVPNLVNKRYVFTPKKRESVFTFFSAGNFFKNKNFELLIDSFAQTFSSEENVRLLIAGDGVERQHIEQKISNLNRGKQISLLGKIDSEHMLENYINCDSFVLLSGHETFGIVYREALAVGRPIISSKNGGIEEGWKNEYGILLEKISVDCASAALRSMYENCNDYYGNVISEMCCEKYSEKVIATRINEILLDALNENRRNKND